MSSGRTTVNQPERVQPLEVQRVLNLLSVTGPAELNATEIARVIGPPLTPEIVHELMLIDRDVLAQHPEMVEDAIVEAERRGELQLKAADLSERT